MSPPKGQWGSAPLVYTPLPTVDEYLEEMRINLRNAKYISGSKLALGHFSLFCQREGITHPTELTRAHIVRFHGIVNGNDNWADSYKRQTMKFVRTWVNWLVDVGYLEANPWVRIKIGRTEKKPHPLSEDDVNALFAAHRRGAFTLTPFHFHRREMLLAIMFSWGLRIHEVEALNAAQFDVRNSIVSAINKGGGFKSLPYGDELRKVYVRWSVQRQRYARADEDALFITTKGDRLTTQRIYTIITDLGTEAGLTITPHQLRDTCGTMLLSDNMSVERVAKILGHTNIKQTLAYAEVRDKSVAADHSRIMDPKLRILFQSTGELMADRIDDD